MTDPRLQSVTDLLLREAELVDDRQWDEWLALFSEDVEYWVPAWDDDSSYTNDPDRELSLIYYKSRSGLEDRVFRIRSGLSYVSSPLPRTCHLVSNIRAGFRDDGCGEVKANWQTLSHNDGKTSAFFGFYEYLLQPQGQGWKIQKKKIIVLNDLIPTVLDIYSI